MSVHQTTDGRWFVRYPKGKVTDDPGRTREYFGRGPDGERKARERNNELGLGISRKIKDTAPPFLEVAQAYVDAKAPAMNKPSRYALSKKLKKIILPRIGRTKASQITPELLDKYVANRLKDVKRTTVHRELSDIRAIIKWAVRRRYLTANPMENYEFPSRDDAVIHPPTIGEIKKILLHAAPHLYRAIIIAYYTGCRAGEVELLRLTWKDIDLDDGNINITSAEKGGLKKRKVPIMDKSFAEMLKKWKKEDKEKKLYPHSPVITYHKKPVKSLKTAWRTAKNEAKITRRIRMYDLRHSFATKLLDNGADLKHVSNLLGHKSVQQTVDTYQHLSRRLTEETVQKLPSIFDDNNPGNTGNTSGKPETPQT